MENKDKKPFSDKKSLVKLIPAVGVIAAMAVCELHGAGGKEASAGTAQTQTSAKSGSEIVRADSLQELISAAYYQDSEKTQTETSDSDKNKTRKKTKKKSGITTGKTKTLPDESEKSSATGQGTTTTPTTTVPKNGYKDGTYTGSATGFGGAITVQVKVSDGKIASIEIVSAAGETSSYLASAKSVISKIISGQSPNVDAVSGATYSSNGIIKAVQNALAKAGKSSTSTKKSSKKTTANKTNSTDSSSSENASDHTQNNGETKAVYQDGTYTGEAGGYSGTVKITITISDGKITSVTNTNTDTPTFFVKAWRRIQAKILDMQSADGIDTVSGATYSSNGILNAAKEALNKAKPAITAAPTATPTPTAVPEPTKAPEEDVPQPSGSIYKDGTYSGTGLGYYDNVSVTLTIKNGKITSLSQSNMDDPDYFDEAWNTISAAVLNKQSADVDAVSGATYSSQGIINAVKRALSQAAIVPSASPTPSATPTPAATPTATPAPTATPTAAPETNVTPESTPDPAEKTDEASSEDAEDRAASGSEEQKTEKGGDES